MDNGKVSKRYLVASIAVGLLATAIVLTVFFMTGFIGERKLIISTPNVSKVFDNEELVVDEWFIKEGKLRNNDYIYCTFRNNKRSEVGENEVSIDVKIIDGFGRDVTNKYEIVLEPGIIKVTPLSIDIKVDKSFESKLIGTYELKETDYTINNMSVFDGYTLEKVEYKVTSNSKTIKYYVYKMIDDRKVYFNDLFTSNVVFND